MGHGKNSHSVNIHALTSVELVVLEVADNLLCEGLGLGLETLDLLVGSTLVLDVLGKLLHVTYT